jgi:tetratricopeptide (TPR) repeat protein
MPKNPTSYLVLPLLSLVAYFLCGGAAPDASRENRLWRHRNLGKALFETPTTVGESVAQLRQAVDLAPDSARDRLNYGLALLRSGDNKEAIVELEKVQKQDPSLPHTWFNLGIAFKRESRYEDAIRQFAHMAELVPDEPISHYNLGLLYRLAEKDDLALRQFEIAAKLDPKLVAPRFQIYNYYRLQGKDEEAVKALAAFQAARQNQQAADESEDVEWCPYAELYDPAAAQPAAEPPGSSPKLSFSPLTLSGAIDPHSAGLIVLDVDGDGRANLLAWSRNGIRLFKNGTQPVAQPELENLKGVVSVVAGDFDNDGLADLCVLTESAPLLFHNSKGKFVRQAANLPTGRFETAVWLDFDHDYDNDLFLFGEKSVLLRNEGEAGFRDYSAQFPFVAGRALEAVALRVVPDTKGIDIAVSYNDRPGVLYRDQLRGVFQAVPLPALARGARSLRVSDIDNDGCFDLAFTPATGEGGVLLAMNRKGSFEPAAIKGAAARLIAFADLENRGYSDLIAGGEVYRNLGSAKFAAGQTFAGVPKSPAWVQADFDGDGRTDLAGVTPEGRILLLRNRTATQNHWLRVGLAGVKSPKLAAGAEVEVKAGPHYQKESYKGLPLLFGLGPYAAVDTVRIGWPNGLIQNERNQPASRTAVYKEAPRLSGSCPMVFAWNGREFQFLADILGVAPLGASSGDGQYFPVDHDEYLQIPAESLAPRDGRYEIRITEELREVSYIDQVRLIALDHPGSLEIYTSEKFKSPPFPEFRLFSVRRRIYPVRAVDDRGRDVLPRLLRRDGSYPDSFRHDLSGVAETHSLELDFGPRAAPDNKAVLVMNGWTDWADGSMFLNTAQRASGGMVMPFLQVKDPAGRWRTVIEDMGLPSGAPRSIVVDLTGKFLSASREVRIVTNLCLYWDQVFLSEETGSPEARLTPMDAGSAELLLRGFSEAVIYQKHEQPEAFLYSRWKPTALWNQTPGRYTRYGPVRELVRSVDDKFVVMGSGDELRLDFDARNLPALPAGWRRDFLLLVDGWSKDGDANTAFADSVEPLPFHGMSTYPYPAREHYPADQAHRQYLQQYNTRPAVKFIWPLTSAR